MNFGPENVLSFFKCSRNFVLTNDIARKITIYLLNTVFVLSAYCMLLERLKDCTVNSTVPKHASFKRKFGVTKVTATVVGQT